MSARGAQHTMPLLVINMGGEMVYVVRPYIPLSFFDVKTERGTLERAMRPR